MNLSTTLTRRPAPAAPPVSGMLPLTPAQAAAHAALETMLAAAPIVGLAGAVGSGRSTLLRHVAEQRGGLRVTASDLVPLTAGQPPEFSDSVIGEYLLGLLDRTDLLVIDDFEALSFSTLTYRPSFMGTVILKHLKACVIRRGKQLLFNGPMWDQFNTPPDLFGHDTGVVGIPGFTAADYACFASNIVGAEKAQGIDFQLVFRFASMLNGHQLQMACGLMAREHAPTAQRFIDTLQRHGITCANTRTDQVEALDLEALPGHEHIAARLMTHIVLPLENHALAQRLNLKPKRGVLLYGPPGTGKTSIGRALAHRMKGKFFIIDGSFISEPPGNFFGKLNKVVEEAKQNSPSVLFIDDADVLFRINHIAGLARYLLSLLDGLESEIANNVCVMMTAMDVRHIPDALLRSGRVELWLETRLPSELARARILEHWMGPDMPDHEPVDFAGLAASTEGFTQADLRRLAVDARSLYAADMVRQRPIGTANTYMRQAIASIIEVRRRMAQSLGDASLRIDAKQHGSSRYGDGVGGLAETGACSVESGW